MTFGKPKRVLILYKFRMRNVVERSRIRIASHHLEYAHTTIRRYMFRHLPAKSIWILSHGPLGVCHTCGVDFFGFFIARTHSVQFLVMPEMSTSIFGHQTLAR